MHKSVELLAWDTNFFGKRVGRLRLVELSGLEESLKEASRDGYEILYVYSSEVVESSLVGGFRLRNVGGQIRFTKRCAENRRFEAIQVPEISEYALDVVLPELLKIILISGHFSRFRVDPSLPKGSFERLYETWLRKALQSRPGSIVYTYMVDDILAGVITGERYGSKFTIDLLGVLPSYRGRGIASMLIQRIEDHCCAKGTDSIEVKTQLTNTGARALYLRNGFAEHDRSFLYHAYNKESTSIECDQLA